MKPAVVASPAQARAFAKVIQQFEGRILELCEQEGNDFPKEIWAELGEMMADYGGDANPLMSFFGGENYAKWL